MRDHKKNQSMSNLPPELIEEILSRVPAKSLKRFRSTCKRWNSLFTEQEFTKKHIARASKQSLVLMLNERKVFSLTINLHGIETNNTDASLIECKGELALIQNSDKVDIHQLFHCDGLLLCMTKNNRLVVWNPCTDETRCIKPCNNHYKYSMYTLGYVDNNSCRSYKLLRYRSTHGTKHQIVKFEIYDFSSDSWRFLEITAKFKFIIRSCGVSLKGNTYWLVFDNYILSFDFSTERLGRLCLPFEDFPYCDSLALSSVGDEKLSVLHHKHIFKMDIWVTTNEKIDETIDLSWRKLVVIDLYNWSSRYEYSSCLNFFIHEEKKVIVSYDTFLSNTTSKKMICVMGECGILKEIEFGEIINDSDHNVIFNYGPSLVRIG